MLVGVAALLTLTLHGGLWIALKTEGEVETRARRLARGAWWALAAFVVLITVASFQVQPHLGESFAARPWGFLFPLLALAGLVGIGVFRGGAQALHAFLSSCLFIVGMLCSAVFGLFPLVLPSSPNPALSLDIYNASAAPYGLGVGLIWFIPGMVLVAAYFVYAYRGFAGKVPR